MAVTNADHVCFINLEPEVLREVRRFLSVSNVVCLQCA